MDFFSFPCVLHVLSLNRLKCKYFLSRVIWSKERYKVLIKICWVGAALVCFCHTWSKGEFIFCLGNTEQRMLCDKVPTYYHIVTLERRDWSFSCGNLRMFLWRCMNSVLPVSWNPFFHPHSMSWEADSRSDKWSLDPVTNHMMQFTPAHYVPLDLF
jgi:hypothetical protein